MRKKWIIGTILLASIAGLLFINLAKTNKAIDVTLTEAVTGTVRESVFAGGTLAASEKEDYYVPFSGLVKDVSIKPGDRVKKGDTLFVMDAAALEEQMRLEEINLEMVRAEERMYRESRMRAARQEVAQGREPENVLDDNELTLYRLRAERSMLAMESLKEKLSKSEVKAEMDGVVALAAIRPGQAAAEGLQAVSLINDRQLEATAYLNELDAVKVKTGMEAIITGDSFDEELAGTVVFVSPIAAPADPASRDASVEIRVEPANVPETLRPGLSVALEIVLPAEPEVLVPLAAVRYSGEQAFVFEAMDGIAVRRDVTVGKDDGQMVEILSGLAPGDKVIGNVTDGIADGVRVNAHD